MSTGTLQSLITVVAFVIFVGIVGWAWSKRRSTAFDEAARIPLDDDLPLPGEGARGASVSASASPSDEVSKEQR